MKKVEQYCGPMRFAHRGMVQNAPENTIGAFEAAMLLPSPEELPHLPPLADIVTANRSLAAFAEAWGTSPKTPPPYQRHLHANQSRGAYALLITNYCSTDRGARLFPLAQALANHRYTLEESCNLLIRSSACNTEPHCIR